METTKGGNSRKFAIAALMGLALSTTLFVSKTHAQAPGQDPTQGAGQNQAGGRGGRAGRGGLAGQLPFANGTIVSGDAASNTITITSQFGGGTQIIHLTQDTKIYTQTTIKASELKVGDKLQVSGVPTSITASTITAGDMPDFLGGGRGRGNRGGGGAAGGLGAPGATGGQTANPGDANAQGNTPPTPPPANATATGTVVGLNPLMISLSDEVTVSLKLKEDAKVTRIAELPYSKLKAGDKLMATGQSNADGSFNATGIGINITQGGRGAGGFGPGGGGFNGGAGGPGGAGFNGGGRGGRGGRGGGGGAAGGAGATGN